MNLKSLNNYIVALTEEHLLSQAHTGAVSTGLCQITSTEQDPRRVSEGCIFVALRGVYVDGMDYIPKVLVAGCRIIVIEHPRPESLSDEVAWLTVTGTARAMTVLASVYYDRPERQLTIIGVAGTNGKTITATLCYQLWN